MMCVLFTDNPIYENSVCINTVQVNSKPNTVLLNDLWSCCIPFTGFLSFKYKGIIFIHKIYISEHTYCTVYAMRKMRETYKINKLQYSISQLTIVEKCASGDLHLYRYLHLMLVYPTTESN